ncbi:MAG: amino acid adenylation domain-containing protein [Pseudoxanthomonas sp.]
MLVNYDPFASGALSRVVPTTEPQRELWLATRLDPDATLAYNESVALQLDGSLDADVLAAALDDVVRVHDALRAGIGPDGETFWVPEQSSFALQRLDLSALSAQARVATVAERRRAGVQTPFVLEQGDLFRAELLTLSPTSYLLLMHAHHIVCDGWSWWVMVRELGQAYAARSGRGGASLTPAERYSDHALALSAQPDGPQAQQDAGYWASRFADAVPVMDLPLDRPRPARRTFASAREDLVLDAALVQAVRKAGAQRGASLFATLLAGFSTLIARISGERDVVIGIPAAGQSMEGQERLVGHCVNLLPLRFDVDPGLPFAQALDAAQTTLLDALEHGRYTFGTLLKTLQVARDPARLPLVSVMFNIDQSLDLQKLGFHGLRGDFTTNPRTHENFELSINAVQIGGGLRLECQYNTDLFDAGTVRHWLSAYGALLSAAAADPACALGRLSLLDTAHKAELDALQPEATRLDVPATMHGAYELQVARTPQATALHAGKRTLTYAQLDTQANRIARFLQAEGIGKGDLVGLALERGPEMLAALLGILKTGAGYVPLDPYFPSSRLSYMVEDARLAALLTQESLVARFDGAPARLLVLERHAVRIDALEGGTCAPAAPIAANDVAYVIYTSGSTGKPKGVCVPHGAVANFLVSMANEPGLDASDVLVAVTTLSFDIAVLELLLPLSVGARVVLADRATAMDGVALAELLSRHGATVMQATPSTWRMMVEIEWHGHSGFRALCGGEPLPADLAKALLPRCGALWNLYGPTETTVWSTCTRVEAAPDGGVPDIHIGRPIANTQVWVVDPNGMPCPVGVPGELCIGGDGVTLGYLHRPELTAERFIPDTLGGGTRLYRTGDRGRWRADGQIEHLGRLDFQVKLRGYRIELGEIESQLVACAGVARAVCVVREDRADDPRLVAYVVPEPGIALDEAGLRVQLRGSLPDYMVPQHLVLLATIPLLPNGKIDRKALPAPQSLTAQSAAPAAAASDDALQEPVRQAMARVLGRAELRADDNFFEVGGHSLLAARLAAELGRLRGTTVPLRCVFEAPTARRLAASLRALSLEDAQAAPVQIAPRTDRRRAPLTPMQQRLWLYEQMEPGTVAYNTPSAHRLRGSMNLLAFQAAFDEMVRRQPSLRTVIVQVGEDAEQRVLDHVSTQLLPPMDLSALEEGARDAALQSQLESMTGTPFALDGHAPLFRARLFRMGQDDHVLYFMTHHLIWDGWSFDVFYSEMSALYAAFSQGQPSPLPALEVDYGDFAQWQQQAGAGQTQASLAYWTRHLAGGLAPLQLPEDRQRPAHASGQGATEWVQVDRATTDALRNVGNATGATLFMTLLAAYFVLLHRLGGQQQLVVGLPVRNRASETLERIMGFFVNVLPLKLQIDPAMPFDAFVARVRDAVVEAFAWQEVPFEALVRALRVPRDLSRSPVYQALFSFQDVRARQTRWGALEHEHLLTFQKGMHTDIGLWFLEHEQGLSGALGYSTDILSDASAGLINQRFVTLLQGLARHPATPIGEIEVRCAKELAWLEQWTAAGLGADVRDAQGQPCAVGVAGERWQPAGQQDGAARSDGAGNRTGERVRLRLNGQLERLGMMPGQAPVVVSASMPSPVVAPPSPALPADNVAMSSLERRIAATMAEVLGVPAVALDDDFFDLGGYSLLAVKLFHRITRQTGVNLPLATLFNAPTVRGLARAYRLAGAQDEAPSAVVEPPNPWAPLVQMRAGEPGRPALFLVHAVGGNIIGYKALVDALPAGFPVYGLQALGLDGKTKPLRSVEHMARLYLTEIRRAQPQGPYHLAGWSMGGAIAYEIACQLRAAGQAVAFLGLVDALASLQANPEDAGELKPGIGGVWSRLRHRVGSQAPQRRASTFWRWLREGAHRRSRHAHAGLYRVLGMELPHGLRYTLVEVVHYQAYLRYRPKPLGLPLVLFRASKQRDERPALGWEDMSSQVEIVEIPGRHASLVQSSALSEALGRALIGTAVSPRAHDERASSTGPALVPVNDLALATTVQDAHFGMRMASQGPQTRLERLIAHTMGEVLESPAVGRDEDFFGLGGHSLPAVRLFHHLNRQTGVNLPLATLLNASTVRDLALAYRAAGAHDEAVQPAVADPWAPLVPMREGNEAQAPLFFIHAVGGNVLNYKPLADALPPGRAVYGLQALGLDGKTAPLRRVELMARRYLEEIRRVQRKGPYHLAGGSMGGAIAYEIARQLHQAGEDVAFLGLFDTLASLEPGATGVGIQATETAGVGRVLRRLQRRADASSPGERLGVVWRWLYEGLGNRTMRSYAALCRHLHLELPHSLRYTYVEVAHYQAYLRYQPQPVDVPIVLFRASAQRDARPALGWEALSTQVEVIEVAGRHATLVESPQLPAALAKALSLAEQQRAPFATTGVTPVGFEAKNEPAFGVRLSATGGKAMCLLCHLLPLGMSAFL